MLHGQRKYWRFENNFLWMKYNLILTPVGKNSIIQNITFNARLSIIDRQDCQINWRKIKTLEEFGTILAELPTLSDLV
jgi:hypothetical protein